MVKITTFSEKNSKKTNYITTLFDLISLYLGN